MRRTLGLLACGVVAVAGTVVPLVSAQATVADPVSGITLDGGAAATASTVVTVTVPAPTDSSSFLQLSDDGGQTWVQKAWTTSLTWSLIDPAAGGAGFDGVKTVTVEGGDGTTWEPLGAESIYLDRSGPSMGGIGVLSADSLENVVTIYAADQGSGVAHVQVSMDGTHWLDLKHPRNDGGSTWLDDRFSFQDGTIGGYIGPGERTVYGRAIDTLGNASYAQPVTVDPTVDSASTMPATFSYPLQAITGHPFTIKPTFDAGYQAAPGQFCVWHLIWGDAAARDDAAYNPSYGQVDFSAPTVDGVCKAWTFTLPYSTVPEYKWSLNITDEADESETYVPDGSMDFRATVDSTSSAITHSNLPLVYTLPDGPVADADGYVTYRVYSVDGAATDNGQWICLPSDGTPTSAWSSQKGGDSFRCKISTTEPYTGFWDREVNNMWWRTGFDPRGDVSKPVVTGVHASAAPGSALSATTSQTRVSWTGADKGSGLRRYELQTSINGHSWKPATLSSALATHRDFVTSTRDTYRYRVRAVDHDSNLGKWAYSVTSRPITVDDTSLKYTTGWSRIPASHALRSSIHVTRRAGAAVSRKATMSACAVSAERTPTSGYAQIYVDGVRVATIDLHSSTSRSAVVVWSTTFTTSRPHTIRIKALGTIGHPQVTIDGIELQH